MMMMTMMMMMNFIASIKIKKALSVDLVRKPFFIFGLLVHFLVF